MDTKLIFILTKDPSFIPMDERYIVYKDSVIPIPKVIVDLYTLVTDKTIWENIDPVFTTIPIDENFINWLYKEPYLIQEINFIGKCNPDMDRFTDMSSIASGIFSYIDQYKNDTPESKFELTMKNDIIADDMNTVLGNIDFDNLIDLPKPEDKIRTECNLVVHICNENDLDIVDPNIKVFFDDHYLNYEEKVAFFKNNLTKIIVDGTERERYGEVAFKDTEEISYHIITNKGTLYRENCEFSIQKHKENQTGSSIEDLKNDTEEN